MRNSRTLILGVLAVFAFIVLFLAGCGDSANTTESTVINIATIGGVTVPVTGTIPVTAITQTAQYTGTVAWNDSPAVFAAETSYTATITLTAQAGYTLEGVTANFFTVAGATLVSNAAHSGIITAVFPATDTDVPIDVNQTPIADDFDIGNLTQTEGSITAVTITPKADKSNGAITIFYDGSITLPTEAGTYTVTFDVAEATGWDAVSGLSAGTLTIVLLNRLEFEYYWIDEHDSLVTTSKGAAIIGPGEMLTITALNEGYTVKHWYLNGVNTGHNENTYNFSSTKPGIHIVSLTVEKDGKLYNTNITITVPSEVTVTYSHNGAGGSSTTPSQTVPIGSSITLPSSASSRADYYFSGWNTSADGSGRYYPRYGSSFTVTSNVTLYAHWIRYTAPEAPELRGRQSPSGTAILEWNAVAGTGISYYIYRSDSGSDGPYRFVESVSSTSYHSSQQISPNTWYRVTARRLYQQGWEQVWAYSAPSNQVWAFNF